MNATSQEPEVANIDTSKMSAGPGAALELTEAVGEKTEKASFVSDMFMGRFNAAKVLPFPEQTTEARDQGEAFLERLEEVLREQVDPDAIDRTGEIPDEV